MIAAIYARKSTSQADVAEEAKSVTRQVEGAKAFIAAKGWTLHEDNVYEDDAVSGALFATRKQFQRMMRDAEAGAFQAIVFFDLDRFGRNARHTMAALNTLTDLGITVWDYSNGQQVDLDSFEGELTTFLKARFAQQAREQARKHTREAMREKAKQGYVTGGKLFGYDNVRVGKGQTTRAVNEAEAAVVKSIYERFAAGDGLRTIALALNISKAPSPRAQQGRANGWSSSSVREVLGRSSYRGEATYGRTKNAYGREVKKADRNSEREHAQVKQPEEQWIRSSCPAIIDQDLAARVDARREQWRARMEEGKQRGRAPQNAGGKYLLSGGLLICPTCGGHFEAFKAPWKKEGIYCCATRRRKPGTCTNTLALPMPSTDEAVLEMVEGEVLGTKFIEELLSLVDRGEADQTATLTADRDRLKGEVHNLIQLAASGVSPEILAADIRQREKDIAKLEAQLRMPRPEQPNIDRLRAAMQQRSEAWKAELRDEPKVARLLLRRLVGPLTLWDASEPDAAFIEWEAAVKPALLEGLTPIQVVASPPGFEPGFQP